MATRYRYFGVFKSHTPDGPSCVFRTWTEPDGQEQEEVFTRSLVWAPSYWTSSMARPGFYDEDYVAIDESVAMQFVEDVRDLHGDGETLEALMEARRPVPVRTRMVTPDEALTLICTAKRVPDEAFRDYIYPDDDPLRVAIRDAHDDGRRQLRDTAEQLILERGDDCPLGALDPLRWYAWAYSEQDRVDRLVDHYVKHGPLQLLGRVLREQAIFLTRQVKVLEEAAAGDPMRHLPVCGVVLVNSHRATGTVWEALAAILRSSTDPETLAQIYDVTEQATGPASYNEVIRSRNLPRALLEAIAERTRYDTSLFLAGII